MKYKTALTIAGSDSSGGAGIQADLKTFSAIGCYGASVITALTAQNTKGVSGVLATPDDFVEQQLDAVFSDITFGAVKIGMLHNKQVILAVAKALKKYKPAWVVLDPVMVAKSGDHLLLPEAVDALKQHLLPLANLLTPNLPELGVLLNRNFDADDWDLDLNELEKLNCQAILIKGGHAGGQSSDDILYDTVSGSLYQYPAQRVDTPNSHGTGCTLSSAIAAYLARGYRLPRAVGAAKTYLHKALQKGADYALGQGQGPVHHFYRWWK